MNQTQKLINEIIKSKLTIGYFNDYGVYITKKYIKIKKFDSWLNTTRYIHRFDINNAAVLAIIQDHAEAIEDNLWGSRYIAPIGFISEILAYAFN